MAKSIVGQGGSRTLINAASATRYSSFAGGDDRSGATTAANTQIRMPVAGVASSLGARITANSRSTSTTLRFNKNGANGNQLITVAAGATGWFEDTSNTDSIAAADLVCFSTISGTGTGTITASVCQFVFEATAGNKQVWAYEGPGSYNQTATPTYIGINGGTATTNESQQQAMVGDSGVWSNLAVYINSNTLTLATATFRSRVNGANGNQVIAVAAGATGWFEDTTNSDTLAAGDLICVSKVGSGTGSGVATNDIQVSLWTPTNGKFTVGGSSALSQTLVGATTQYATPWGRKPKSAIAADVTSRIPMAGVLSGFRIRLVSGSFSVAPATFELFINGVAASQNITVPTGVNGRFEDTTNTDAVLAGDDITVQIVNSGTSGTVYLAELLLDFNEPQNLTLSPDQARIEFRGLLPQVGVILTPDTGRVEFTGLVPDVIQQVTLTPDPGRIEFRGLLPDLIQTEVKASQTPVAVVGQGPPDLRATQAGAAVIAAVIPEIEATSAAGLVLAEVVPTVRATFGGLIVIADAVKCVTRWQQLWRIRRRDGVTHRFTSLDRPFSWGGQVYRSCRSLQPSASEDQTNIGGVGSQELRGIVDLEGVSEADLEAGLYDDAFVDVWLVPWEGSESPRRIASGWVGKVTYDDDGFEMEVTGPGARLEQQALIQLFTPACRWVFGDPETCQKDIESLKLTGEVLGSKSRDRFFAVLANDSTGGSGAASESGVEWANGRVRWLSGRNAGQITEVKTIDFASGLVTLWALTGFVPQASDAFEILPGCSKDPDACKGYDNYINFGGFPDVPGEDSIQETPDAKY